MNTILILFSEEVTVVVTYENYGYLELITKTLNIVSYEKKYCNISSTSLHLRLEFII